MTTLDFSRGVLVLLGLFIVTTPYVYCWQFIRQELCDFRRLKSVCLIFIVASIPGVLVFYGLTLYGLLRIEELIDFIR